MTTMLPSGSTTLLCPDFCIIHPTFAVIWVQVAPPFTDRQTSFLPLPPMRTILPSGSTTLLCLWRSDHSALDVTSVQVFPPSSDRQTSFLQSSLLTLLNPPMRMMLPSDNTTLLCPIRPDHPALAATRVQVSPPSVDRQTSFL